VTVALVKATANTNEPTAPAPRSRSREFLERQAFEAFKAFLCAVQECLTAAPITTEPASDVMTVDEAAAFLGVDRNTVYEYTTRGVIPHQRLGKRILLRRGALIAWLDASLCAPTANPP
jgi:excisionase family DNA binding protein